MFGLGDSCWAAQKFLAFRSSLDSRFAQWLDISVTVRLFIFRTDLFIQQ